MFILIPGKMGQLTGWKAIGVLVIIVGVGGLSMWAQFQPRSVGSGTWEIPPGQAYHYNFTSKDYTKLKVEFVPQGASAATDSYQIYLVDEANKAKWDNPMTDPKTVQKIIESKSTGPYTIPELTIGAGSFYIIAENLGKTPISLKYKLYELSK